MLMQSFSLNNNKFFLTSSIFKGSIHKLSSNTCSLLFKFTPNRSIDKSTFIICNPKPNPKPNSKPIFSISNLSSLELYKNKLKSAFYNLLADGIYISES